VHEPLPAPKLTLPEVRPYSLTLDDLALSARMNRGAEVVARYVDPGEDAALARLESFLDAKVADYATMRDRPDLDATSSMSDHLALGEISPRTIWTLAQRRRQGGKSEGATIFLKEIVWREFAYHLLHHTPRIETGNWREQWDDFPWRDDNEDAERWRQGRTGVPAVDAAMRELHVTGRMHNRMRMLTASYLTKHLMTHWRVGEAFFAEHLVDWDPASNAMGWQWTAGSGPDASPFFRIFNPETQGEKFDPMGAYRRRFLAELSAAPPEDALAFFDAVPRSWGLRPDDRYPDPIVDLKTGRQRALDAYSALRDRAA
ncbi:MAG: deoxyribodipyrimidine photo-lyase, partial [Pseudomonadota bacterium]